MSALRRHREPLLGLAFLVVIALLITLSIADYRKALPWQHGLDVTLSTPSAGLQLDPPAEVKFDGLIVGEVRKVTTDGQQAVLHIALNPADRHYIPQNVDAALLPKTLFGEKYVNLQLPATPSGTTIEAGDQIHQSAASVELSAIFNDLGPVLDTIRPDQLAPTLTALSQALSGRGAELGQNISLLHRYLAGFDPHIDELTDDLRLLAKTSNTYADAAPDLVALLDNTRAISSQLLVPKQRSFADFLAETTASATETTSVLKQDGDQLIGLADRAEPPLAILGHYSSALPCLIKALYVGNGGLDHVFGGPGPYLKVSIDSLVANKPYTDPKDLPTNPHSDANNNNLPAGIPWTPYCVKLPSGISGQKDAKPYTLEFEPSPTASYQSLLLNATKGSAPKGGGGK
jgi:phospholipid/cholesterol/gamma-HCH transport system substrate-binding protein